MKYLLLLVNFKKLKKSKVNPKRKDTAIEIYLSRLEEEIFSLDKKCSYSNLTKEERQPIYSLGDNTSIILKELIKALGLWSGTERTI